MNAINRRDWLQFVPGGLTAAALAFLANESQPASALEPGVPPGCHFAPRARRVIHLYCCGGVSQIDTFDYRPALAKYHGQPLPSGERPDVFFGQVGLLRKEDWAFQQRGQSGLWVSDLLPNLAGVADELTVIKSMQAETSNHTPATFQAHTGFRLNGFPVMGSWLSYGLGSDSQELPAFVVLPDVRGVPAGGSINWSNGFLPAVHQGVALATKGQPIKYLFPEQEIAPETETASRAFLDELNARHLSQHGLEDELLARMNAYRLAAKMQLSVPDAMATHDEPEHIHQLYGLNRKETQEFGRNCLLARRLLERGVRMVQLFAGGAFGSPRYNWDGHEDMLQNHGQEALRFDQPVAALITDLRQRGLLEDTLIVCTSEFGRTPFAQSKDGELGTGRDHNQYGFTVWLAGAGLKPGVSYGATDDFGLRAVENPLSWHDLHATILHLLGIDHERLTYYHNGINRRLTNVSGNVVDAVLEQAGPAT